MVLSHAEAYSEDPLFISPDKLRKTQAILTLKSGESVEVPILLDDEADFYLKDVCVLLAAAFLFEGATEVTLHDCIFVDQSDFLAMLTKPIDHTDLTIYLAMWQKLKELGADQYLQPDLLEASAELR